MKKREFLAKLDSLKLPTYHYVIIAGGAMLMHGLREETADIDLAVSEQLADELGIYRKKPNERGTHVIDKDVEVIIGMNRVEYEEFEGHLVQTLPSVLRDKQRLNRPKDQKDVETIIDYFTHQSRS